MNKILQILAIGILTLASGNVYASEQAEDYFRKGIELDQLGKYEDALKSYDKAIELNLHNSDAIKNRELAQKLMKESR